jgi:hypothetical protein
MAVNKQGVVAIIYVARMHDDRSFILDFDLTQLRPDIFTTMAQKVLALVDQCKARIGSAFVQPELMRQAWIAGVNVYEIPETILDPESMLISAGAHIAAGRVKICAPAHEKSKTLPFGAAFDFRSGDGGDDPLRLAALWAVSLSFDPG